MINFLLALPGELLYSQQNPSLIEHYTGKNMAEIRSTLDMVMERAAKMADESSKNTASEDSEKAGMRLAAEFLSSGKTDLATALKEQPADKQKAVIGGMADTLLRNIVLPRDEMLLENSMRALEGVSNLGSGVVTSACSELQQILNQYNQHKDQMVEQLNGTIRGQIEQQMAQSGQQVSDDISINPSMHPQYQEELNKMLTDLNGQYNQALDERKAVIKQQLITGR